MSTTMVYVPAADPEVRRSGIGSSDAAVVAGLNRWKTPLDLYLEKRGLVEPEPAGEAAEWGTILEPVLLREFARRNGVNVVGRGEHGVPVCYCADGVVIPAAEITEAVALLDTLRHPEHEWMMCHLDGVALSPVDREVVGVVEAKTTSEHRSGEWGDSDDAIPEEYIVQTQHALEIVRAILGRAVPAYVPVLIGGQRWRQYTVHHDAELVASLIEIEREFWRRVEDGNPPPAEPDERGAKALAKLYPQHDEGREIVAEPGSELEALARQLADAKAALADAELRVTAAENAIKERMAEAAKVVGAGFSVTWKTQSRRTVDYRALIEELNVPAELIEKHTRESATRVFRFAWKGV
ncbi:MAG TPA: YqaJ viral recombinase family protein [Thermomicrobiales bacterium]